MLKIIHPVNNKIHSVCISISCTYKSLWRGTISISAIRCDERGEMFVFLMYRYRVVSMPIIQYWFNCVPRHWHCYCMGRFCMVRLSWGVLVNGPKIYNVPRWPIGFGGDHHSTTPFRWFVNRDGLQNPKFDISVETFLDFFVPVGWDYTGWIGCDRRCLGVDEEA